MTAKMVRNGGAIVSGRPKFLVQLLAVRGLLPDFWHTKHMDILDTVLFSQKVQKNPRVLMIFHQKWVDESPELTAALTKLTVAKPEVWRNPENALLYPNPWGKHE